MRLASRKRLKNIQGSLHFTKSQTLGITFNIDKNSRYFPVIIPSDTINLGREKILQFPELTIQNGEKIGIIGNNGAGKSTFIIRFLNMLNLPSEKVIYIPQEITIEHSKSIINRIQNYKSEMKGQLMTVISRLGSDPNHVLETTIPSPGEVRKLMLAEGIMTNPAMIIMDEPTNHMDLPSIECVEKALNECGCSQLLVSHDMAFLGKTVHYFWFFEQVNNNEFRIKRKI